MVTTISNWDASRFLNNEEDVNAYLDAIMGYDDPALFRQAVGNVAKAHGMERTVTQTRRAVTNRDKLVS